MHDELLTSESRFSDVPFELGNVRPNSIIIVGGLSQARA